MLEIIRPAASVSVNATPFSVGLALFGLMVNESEGGRRREKLHAAPNDLEMVGADAPDVMVNGMPLLGAARRRHRNQHGAAPRRHGGGGTLAAAPGR